MFACPAGETKFDFDGDGWDDSMDCDPENGTVHPEAADLYGDGIDQNCDGADGVDTDGDGWPAPGPGTEGAVVDCDDGSSSVHPGAEEVPGNEVDEDCDGNDFLDSDGDGTADDEDCAPFDVALNSEDADSDGSSTCDGDCDDEDATVTALDLDGDGWTSCQGDCDDVNASTWPGADEVCDADDNDCDGVLPDGEQDADLDGYAVCEGDCQDGNSAITPVDNDGDGYHLCSPTPDCDDTNAVLNPEDLDFDGYSPCTGDCDDGDPSRNPSIEEACDGEDQDCDGELLPGELDDIDLDGALACADCDDNDANAAGLDEDGDGFTPCGGDCDEASAAIFAGAFDEWGDGVDTDCDGVDGNDLDGDGYAGDALPGSTSNPAWDCNDADPATNRDDVDGDGVDTCGLDCDDGDGTRFPGNADDACDGLDTDCEADPLEADDDGDGWFECQGDCDDGDVALNLDDLDGDGATTCGADGVAASGDEDCDDGDPARYPANAEDACDGVDSDCVADSDEVDNDFDGWFECQGDCDDGDSAVNLDDVDGDGVDTCGADGLASSGDEDCDDTDGTRYPGNAEDACDGLETDCVPDPLEVDDDGDGWLECEGDCDDGDASFQLDDADSDGVTTCGADGLPDTADDDCDDSDGGAFPGNVEDACDGVDSDCLADPLEMDDDGDGWFECAGDCDDADPTIGPFDLDGDGASACDGDCDDADPALNLLDADGDVWSTCAGDCDDSDPQIRPSAPDVCSDAVDTNCDGGLDEELDDDGDGQAECEGDCDDTDPILNTLDADEDGHTTCAGDCDDADPARNPDQDETWDLIDEDCDGGVDENVNLSTAPRAFLGEADDDYAGWAVAGAGDIDGDGLDDILIGAWGNDRGGADAGSVYLFLGSDLAAEQTVDVGTAHTILVGEAAGDRVGSWVAGGCDVDGDGFDDILIGASNNDEVAESAGKAYLVLGSTADDGGTMDLAGADASFLGEAEGDAAGARLACDGDVDGDGLHDILISASAADTPAENAGKSYLLLGASIGAGGSFDLADADAVFLGEVAGDYSGASVDFAGDVDGDGLDDILVGAPNHDGVGDLSGKAYLVLGATAAAGGTSGLEDAYAWFAGEVAGDRAGKVVVGPGDLDGDGLDDILVGTHNTGIVYVVLGSTAVVGGGLDLGYADAEVNCTNCGWVADGAGDVDGDGNADLVVGNYTTNGSEQTHFYRGTGGPAILLGGVTWFGEGSYIRSGWSVAGAGDVNGDGLDDILVGARWFDVWPSGDRNGKAYLLLSPY